jgi:hypothetical protein
MIKKLLLSSLILILSWNSFSQTVTPIRDTSRIVLSTETARRVAVDLLEGDKAREEVQILSKEIDTLKAVVALQDSLVILRENEIKDLNKIVELQTIGDKEKLQRIDNLNRELKKQATLKTVFETTTGVATIALIISLIVH